MEIKFEYDSLRAAEAALSLLNLHGGSMDLLKLVKLVFLADREHLARYGRPIIGGKYVAMKHGPVPSVFYNWIDGCKILEDKDIDVSENTVSGKRTPNTYYLSETDVETINDTFDKYGHMSTSQLWRMVHDLNAWKKNYPDPEENTSYDLPYEDFFLDIEDDSILEIIREDQDNPLAG